MTTELPIPPFVDLAANNTWEYDPDPLALYERALAWRREHAIRPSASDAAAVHLALIDVQRDFCFPRGTLYVAGRSGDGAVCDNARIAAWIYRNAARVTDITTTFDLHLAVQIFHAPFWVDAAGEPIQPFRTITADQVQAGEVRPNPAIAGWLCNGNYGWLVQYALHYCQELERAGKYQLYIWPFHCLAGSGGHSLVGIVHEARLFHAFVRSAQTLVEMKGRHPLTEHYSPIKPEVMTLPGGEPLPGAQTNTRFLQTLASSRRVVVMGQAGSHCTRAFIDDVLDYVISLPGEGRELASRIYVVRDCMSPVVIRDADGAIVADFTPQMDEALQRFAAAGMHVVESTTPIEDWPNFA